MISRDQMRTADRIIVNVLQKVRHLPSQLPREILLRCFLSARQLHSVLLFCQVSAPCYTGGVYPVSTAAHCSKKDADPLLTGTRCCCSTPCRCSRWGLLMASIICKLTSSSQGPKQSRVKGRWNEIPDSS